jgi:hypothetical protein
MIETLRIALVTDIHHGEQAGTKVGPAALPLLRDFFTWANALSPDLVVELGDRINNVDEAADERLTRQVRAAFHTLRPAVVHLLGNHDHHDLPRAIAEDAMQTSFASSSRDMNGFHLVFWNADTSMRGRDGFLLSEEDLAWLKQDLAITTLPTIIFTHLPLDSGSMIGNFYFEAYLPGHGHHANAALAREIIERSGKVILCIAGHTHWNTRSTIDGIHYLTIHSLTESCTTMPAPTGAHALLQVGECIELDVLGRDPAWCRLPIRPLGVHWASLSRDFAPKPERLSRGMRKWIASRESGA